MTRPFDRVLVVGVGLIGGSAALRMRAGEDPPFVTGIARGEDTRRVALQRGALDEAIGPDDADADAALLAADLVILGTPVDATIAWLERLGAIGFTGVVTDVASTKTAVFEAAERLLAPDAVFIGGHPMAGSERSGIEAATPELFEGAYYVLTPSDRTDPDAYRRLHTLVTSLGARVIVVHPKAHDEAVAAISHVPHVAASALTNLAAARADAGEDVLRLAAGGFKDMTRIAAGSAELWTGICLDNRVAVVRGLREYQRLLDEFAALLEAGSPRPVIDWLERAAEVRRSLPAQWVPASDRLRVLAVPMSDRPGAIASITQMATRYACNIEDIEIDHTSEDHAVLRLLLTDEGDADGLTAELRVQGFDPELHALLDERAAADGREGLGA